MPSVSIVGVSARFEAAYFSIVDGFRRKPFVLGLSNVEAEDPDISEGVLMGCGGTKTPFCRDGGTAEVPAPEGSGSGATDALLDAAGGLCADVTDAAARSVLFVPCSILSEGVMLRLALFAKRETCWAALLCLPSVLLLLLGLVGMRLDGLRWACEGASSRCGGCLKCDRNVVAIAGTPVVNTTAAKHTPRAEGISTQRRMRKGVHWAICCVWSSGSCLLRCGLKVVGLSNSRF